MPGDEGRSNLLAEVMKKCSDKLIPAVVQFELTNNCNLSCRHCNFIRKNQLELSTDELKDIFNQLKEMGTFFLAFSGGEIFTRKDFLELAAYAKKEGFILTFMTNGTLIKPEHIEKIKAIKPRNFEISLLGATAETHDRITGVQGSFDRAVWSIKELVQAGIAVITKTPLMNLNVAEYEEIRSLSKRLGANPMISPGITPRKDGSREPQEFSLSFEDMKTHIPDNPSNPTYFFRWESSPKSKICSAGRSTCLIAPNGDIYPCVLMPIKIGNTREGRLKDIWLGQESKDLERLRDLKEKDIEGCNNCEKAEFCHRCAGVAFLETGDFTAPSPSACQLAGYKKTLLCDIIF